MPDDQPLPWWRNDRDRSETARSRLYELLRQKPEIARMEVEYDGCGDSGQIEDIRFFNAKKQPLKIDDEPLVSAIEGYVFSLLPMGWENDTGAFGTIRIDVHGQKTNVKHNERFEDFYTNEFED
jgi:hypothetical protein